MGRVAFIHPDLGIGGAERLVVDAAKALQDSGHEVSIYTGYHDVNRCFGETKNGLLKTIPVGSWIPRTIAGKCHALMAYLKMIYVALYLLLFAQSMDLIFCDQVSACIPFLKLNFLRRRSCKIVFYCHFPDQLLTQRDCLMKALYRQPLDKFEEWSTSLADIILVNSKFTRSVVMRTFPSLRNRDLKVLYPCVDVNSLIDSRPSKKICDKIYKEYKELSRDKFIYLSLNRFERKKGLETAIEAFSDCVFKIEHDSDSLNLSKSNTKSGVHLIVAGGYDPRLPDSVGYYEELAGLTLDFEVLDHVTFIKSPSDEDKLCLFEICDAVVYTPENEHFGIVPLEAMAMSKPVIASASGGPLETVSDGENGFLCPRDDDGSFINAMISLYCNQELSVEMGKRGLSRVKEYFSYETFRDNLVEICFPARPPSKRT